jgi:hypothetical protein
VLQPLFSVDSNKRTFALYAFAIAAGFSETLIPNILRRTEEGDAIPEGRRPRDKDDEKPLQPPAPTSALAIITSMLPEGATNKPYPLTSLQFKGLI